MKRTWSAVTMVLWALGVSACCSAPAAEREPPRAEPQVEQVEPAEPQKEALDPAQAARCTESKDFAALSHEDAQAWRAECKAAFDCTKPLPPKACCLAMTPECLRCADEGRAAKAAFDFACFGETTPVPEVADCSAPPQLTPCCKALIPKCLDCVAKNRYQAELHRTQCGDAP